MSEKTRHLFAFGPFHLDARECLLILDGKTVPLAHKAFEALLMLVENAGHLVDKDDLMRRLWPDTFVEEANVAKHVSLLRKVLSEATNGREYIETIPKRGYRFVVDVREVADAESDSPPQVLPGANLIGKKVSHYRVLEILGGGGMGLVYKAEDLKLGRRVALKFLPEELVSDAVALGRLEREARAASALNHPNICTIYAIEEHEGQPFIAMELLEGETLRELISAAVASPLTASNQRAPLQLDKLLDVAIQVTEGLDAAHRQGIIHRDIKPANVFVTSQGQAKILDFGLATLQASDAAEPQLSATGEKQAKQEWDPNLTLTRTGVTIGTAGYMSPEQIRGEKLDARTDLFSFGMVLYEMATGQRAFVGDTAPVLREAILNHTPTLVRKLNSKIPIRLEGIINKALEKDRDARYQTASGMRADLQHLEQDRTLRRFAPTSDEEVKVVVAHNSNLQVQVEETRSRSWLVLASNRKIAVFATIAATVAAAVLGSLFWQSRQAQVLTGKETIVLGDFANSTGEGVFNGTLRQGTSIQLQQSPFLKLVSEEEIHRTLLMMGQKTNTQITPEIAREVCRRTNGSVALDGSILLIGTRYELSLRAVDCVRGELLASAEAQAKGKNDILDALRRLASEMRGKLGESFASVQRHDTPLKQVTTPSLEALQYYNLGLNIQSQTGDFTGSLLSFQRAIKLDPNFAMAYWAISDAYSTIGETASSAEYIRKAFALRLRVGEPEQSIIEGDYYFYGLGDLMRAQRSFELHTKMYPDAQYPHILLASISMMLGRYEAALSESREALRLGPFFTPFYRILALNYLLSDRVEDAVRVANDAHAKGLDPDLGAVLYGIAFYRDDNAGMSREAANATGKLGKEDLLLAMQADTAAYFGHLGNARDFCQRAILAAERAGEKETAAGYSATCALREALFAHKNEARLLAAMARQKARGRDMDYGVALALAYAGEVNLAQALANDLAKRYPEDTIVQFNYLPTLRAKLALKRSVPQQAIDILALAIPYELGLPAYSFYNWADLYPVYVRGEAYLAAHQGGKAAAEFQKVLDHRGLVLNEPIGALAHLELARAYAMTGNTSKAKTTYQEFLALWKDADPDIPILKEAKAEYAKLQ